MNWIELNSSTQPPNYVVDWHCAAKYLGLKSPVPYKFRKYKPNNLKYGMNFAFGGTGVFDTLAPYPNMTTQIDFFERLHKDSLFTHSDLQNSIAHVSLVGNDYSAYLSRGGTIQVTYYIYTSSVSKYILDHGLIFSLCVFKFYIRRNIIM